MSGMTIGELAKQAGVTAKAVRYYESLGLIESARLANGYRSYREDDVRLVREINALRGLGIPVARTRPFLECLEAGHPHSDECPASLAGLRDAIRETTERIEALSSRRTALIAQLAAAAHRGSAAAPALWRSYLALPEGLPVPEDDGAAAHLPGARVPKLSLADTSGAAVRLDELGPRRAVLYIYPSPAARTSTCRRAGTPSPERGAAPRSRAASATTSTTSSKRGQDACTGCPARTPTTSAKSSNGSTCRSTCCPTPASAWPKPSGCPPSRRAGPGCTRG
ncbi:hypothetical protein HMPREF9336_01296 [Segniliparus rugosus ATCC BAA-974]|uniref:HTH merR-type domain-containing protein n=1 Tax=Segniliparus rugosus (strain ATCC BAA-974 / DSM 45345 / CCUG 50838 / CIP 108380 / JCM 13579 / CDC 945) TaxID=679197 RepID=E5XP75_SEGRC|nr:hypothetical protein HMPREF9336_01296 [Segniliparus rugosus ATCC BAA-974]